MINRIGLCLALLGAMLVAGCDKVVEREAAPPPPSRYAGPDFLIGTIGSLTTTRGYQPMVVAGYGLVVNLRGTGSAECPPQLRQWFINELTRGGFGSASYGFEYLTPEQVLASNQTAVVLVEGIIPPGGTTGTDFDVAVAAVGSETTSLEGGVLYSTEMRYGGAYPGQPQSRPMARASGPLFLNPFIRGERINPEDRPDDPRVARVLNGATLLNDMGLGLVLNQPNHIMAGRIRDRLNGRFPQGPGDKFPLANPKSPEFIQLTVLRRFQTNPRHMLGVINHLYLNPTPSFTREKAPQLAEMLRDPANHRHAESVALVWEGMARPVLSAIEPYYTDPEPVVQLTALTAGARLGDMATMEPLAKLAGSNRGEVVERAAELLGHLLVQHPRSGPLRQIHYELLSCDDVLARMWAVDALSSVGDDAVVHRRFYDGSDRLKFELTLVNSDKPLIYVTRQGTPRVVIFNKMLGFHYPLFMSLWEDRLMVRSTGENEGVSVYFSPTREAGGRKEKIAPAVGSLVYLLAYRPEQDDTTTGFNLSYSQVVRVLHELCEQDLVEGSLMLQPTNLLQRISRYRISDVAAPRPETRTQQPDRGSPPFQADPDNQ
jgi:hypothetical protein